MRLRQAIYLARPGLSVKGLIEAAERELASLGLDAIDDAADAALTLSGLRTEPRDGFEGNPGGKGLLLGRHPNVNTMSGPTVDGVNENETEPLRKPSSFTIHSSIMAHFQPIF